jgi:deoxyribose-phosphate aldolase
MAVITISRESGARGSYIGRKLAERLGYLYLDREVIHEVSMEYGVREDEFEHIYEHAPGILERYGRRNREIVQLIGRTIAGLAQRDNVVVVARDAFAALRDYGDVLNVHIAASRGVRVRRFQEDHQLNPQQARAMLDHLDNERSKYIGAYYGLDWADAGLYDLCVNTNKLAADQLIELILQALSHLEENQDLERPLVRDVDVDPILSKAITEALNLLEATGKLIQYDLTTDELIEIIDKDPTQIARVIDNTLLQPDATARQIRQLCAESLQYNFASVCVNPTHVKLAAKRLRGSDVKVCTVIGFPLGALTTEAKILETEQTINNGAVEVDMVINIGALKEGDDALVEQDIASVVKATHERGALCKVIIEAALLTYEEKVRVCQLAKQAGADFVKTSTGFSTGGATIEDVALMRRTVGPTMGVKASGGIRALAQAKEMIAAGANRLGTGSGLKIAQEAEAFSQKTEQ